MALRNSRLTAEVIPDAGRRLVVTATDASAMETFSGEQPPAHRCTQRAKRGRLAGRIYGDVLTHEDATGARPYAAGLRAVLEANLDMYSDVLIDHIGKHVAPFAV